MATVTFILGLCGSGKTWLADRIVAARKFDESFLGDQKAHEALIDALRGGNDCVVVEIAYSCEAKRKEIINELKRELNDVKINWLCIENDLFRANKNCRERTNKGDPEGHIRTNELYSPQYTYPDGSTVFKMWTKGS